MANTYQKILLSGNYENYKALQTKDPNVLYFCEDVGKIFKGEVDYTDHVIVAPTKPTTPITGKIYILSDTNTVEAYVNGNWRVISYPLATTIDKDSDDLHAVTAKAVYDALKNVAQGTLENAVTYISKTPDNKPATLLVQYNDDTDIEEELVIPGVVMEPDWDPALRKLTFPVSESTATGENFVRDVEIYLGKDIFIDPDADNGYNTKEKSIDLYLNDGQGSFPSTLVRIPITDLVDSIQTISGDYGEGTESYINEDGRLHVDLIIDSSNNNALTLTGDGLMVDLSGYVTIEDFYDLSETVDNLAEATTSWGSF